MHGELFIDANEFAVSSQIDPIHWQAATHRAFGKAMAAHMEVLATGGQEAGLMFVRIGLPMIFVFCGHRPLSPARSPSLMQRPLLCCSSGFPSLHCCSVDDAGGAFLVGTPAPGNSSAAGKDRFCQMDGGRFWQPPLSG